MIPTHLAELTFTEAQAVELFVTELKRHWGSRILAVILFGSRIRGQAQPDSDLDLAIVFDETDPNICQAVRYLAVEIGLKFNLYLSTRVWSQAHWRQLEQLQTGLYRNLQQEGLKVL